MRGLLTGLALASITTFSATGASSQVPVLNDYPTVARADYVFGCMAANGQTILSRGQKHRVLLQGVQQAACPKLSIVPMDRDLAAG